MSAYERGRLAYEDGAWFCCNPYEVNTAESQEWLDGWYDAYYCELGV